MKRLLLLLVACIAFAATPTASAHVFEENQGVKVELHMPPDDRPKAGAPTRLELDYSTEKDDFKVADCSCTVQVKREGKTVETVRVAPGAIEAGNGGVAQVNFPEVGTYDLIVAGRADTGAFKDFSVTYDVSVRSVSNVAKAKAWGAGDLMIVGGGGMLVVALFGYNLVRGRKHTKS
jgi:hypothetical protein